MGQVTSLQSAIGQGEPMALVDLHALLHPELRRSGDLTLLDTSSWVREFCLQFEKSGALVMDDHAQFAAYAARAMRSVVVDAVRSQQTGCRGGDAKHVGLDDEHTTAAADPRDSEVPRGLESLAEVAASTRGLCRSSRCATSGA